MDDRHIAIIGGGIAGLSAAVHAIQHGWQPLVMEATPSLGGRARSLALRDVQETIDNGQHVLAAAYRETRRFLDLIGAGHRVHYQDRLTIQFNLNARNRFVFQSWKLPAPLHFLAPLLVKAPLSSVDRRFLSRFAMLYMRLRESDLRQLTVREWLDAAGSAPFLEKMLWEPLTLATLNTPIETASAFLLHRVLKLSFLGNARQSGLGIPKAPLSEIFAHPAETYLRAHKAEIRANVAVRRIICEDQRVVAVEIRGGERLVVSRMVLAVPPHAASRLFRDSPEMPEQFTVDPAKFDYSPIITIYLWLTLPIPGIFPMAFVDSPLQWIFPLPEPSSTKGIHGYALVISAAQRFLPLSDAEILDAIGSEFRHYFLKDLKTGLGLKKWKVVKEKRATFLQTPASLRWRPSPQTPVSNLALAGDWIDTGLPATIESAVMSGRLAIEALR